MNASDIMTRRVIAVGPKDTLAKAIGLMLEHGISGLPVVDDTGKLPGMLTEGDMLRRAEIGTERKRPRWLKFLIGPGKLADEYVHTHGRKVEDVMTTDVISVLPDARLDEIVSLMERHHIKRMPVLENGSLVGILSRANLLHAVSAAASAIPEATPSDQGILIQLWKELDNTDWAPSATTNFVVRDGVVHLHGIVTDDHQREALRTVAANIPGVKTVRDHLVWCDPMSGTVIY